MKSKVDLCCIIFLSIISKRLLYNWLSAKFNWQVQPSMNQLNSIDGVVFVRKGYDVSCLERNIQLIATFVRNIHIVCNGENNFEISQDNFLSIDRSRLFIHYDFSRRFVDVATDFIVSHQYPLLKFDDDDLYLKSALQRILFLWQANPGKLVSMRPFIYRWERASGEVRYGLNRRVFLPNYILKRRGICGTLLVIPKINKRLVPQASDKYLDRYLNRKFRNAFVIEGNLDILVRRLDTRNHMSKVEQKAFLLF